MVREVIAACTLKIRMSKWETTFSTASNSCLRGQECLVSHWETMKGVVGNKDLSHGNYT